MSDYTELVKALRCCTEDKCGQCNYNWNPNREFCMNSMCRSAAAAIEALEAEVEKYKRLNNALENLLSEDKEPKRGEWEREMDVNDEPFYQCSVCGECFDFNSDSTHEVFNYCPNCGADMRKMEVQE